MADERITLSYDTADAIAASGKVNKAIESNEKAAEKAVSSIGGATEKVVTSIVSVTDRSQNAINRIVAAAERKAALAVASPAELRLDAKQRDLGRVKGDVEASNRITVAYEKQEIAARKASDALQLQSAITASRQAARGADEFAAALNRVEKQAVAARKAADASQLQSAITASRQAAKGADEFAAALNRVNLAAQKERESIEQGIRALERRAALAGKSPNQRLVFEANSAIASASPRTTPEQMQRLIAGHREIIRQQVKASETSNDLGGSIFQLAGRMGLAIGAFEAFRSVLGFGKDAVLYAARTEQLGVALNAVARANKIAESTTATLEARLKITGIVTQDARQSLSRLVAAQVDHTKAVQLARAAQDLSRIAGITSSEAFERLTHAIVTQQPELLRMLGLNVNLELEFQKVAKQSGRVSTDLSEMEKRQIAVNAVLVAAKGYTSVYEESLKTAGGQLLSLQRYALEAKDAFGQEFLPALTLVAKALTLVAKEGETAGKFLAKGFKFALIPVTGLIDAADVLKEKLQLLNPLLEENNRRSLEADNKKLVSQKTLEGSSKALREQEEIIERSRIAQLEKDKKDKEELLKFNERALEFLKSAQFQEGEGLDRIAIKRKQALNEFGKSPEARANIEKAIAIERAKFLSDFEQKRFKDVEKFEKSMSDGRNKRTMEDFDRETKFTQDISKLEEQTRKAIDENSLFGLEARKESELRGVKEVTGKRVEDRLAAEDKIAAIEVDFALKTYAIKAELINKEAVLRAAMVTTLGEKQAIMQEAAARGALLMAQSQAVVDAAGENAAIKKLEIIRDANQKTFDSIKNAAEGLFDTLVLRTKSWGDLLRNTVLLPALTLVKQLVSTAIAGALTGRSGGGTSGGGLGGLLGGLLGGVRISRAGAPGGTPGFTGPVGGGGISGMLAGLGGGGAGAGSKLAGLGGAGGLGLAAAALGGFGAFKAGQADNKVLKYSAPAIGAVAGLVGFGSLASLFPALIAAGPAGWIAAAGIGATIGLIGVFKKKAEDKIIEKIKSVYGITVDRSFAKNPLAGIIKDQFGGNIEAGIRSPIIREMLSIYRMQSNQAGAGSGLSPYNDSARGVSLSGYGGGVFQNPVSVNGGSYGYGGALPSTGPSQPFQQPIVIENRLQIDGRDVQASVLRTNQGSTGRRESAAVLSDPLLVFG